MITIILCFFFTTPRGGDHTTRQDELQWLCYVVFPYAEGVSERIGPVYKEQKVKLANKPQVTICNDFDRQNSDTVHKISCT